MGKFLCHFKRRIKQVPKREFKKVVFVPEVISVPEGKEVLEFCTSHFPDYQLDATNDPRARRAELGLSRRESMIYKPLYRKHGIDFSISEAAQLHTVVIRFASHQAAAEAWAEAKWPGKVSGYIIQRAAVAYLKERGNPPGLVIFDPKEAGIRTERSIRMRKPRQPAIA